MLSQSGRNKDVTAQILGDPRPDRFERSDKIRELVKYSPPPVQGGTRSPYRKKTAKDRIHMCLEAVMEGYSTIPAIRGRVSGSYRSVGEYVGQANRNNWVRVKEIIPVSKSGGRLFVYAITPDGLAELKRVSEQSVVE